MPIEWQRLSPWAALSLNGGITNALYFVVALSFVATRALDLSRVESVATGLAGLVLWLLIGLLQYWRFLYLVTPDGIRVRKGVMSKTEVFIRFARVQGVIVTSNLFYRLLGLVNIKLDTAGAAQQEGVLPAVLPAIARDIQIKVKAARSDKDVPLESTGQPTGQSSTLLRMPALEIAKFGATSSQMFLVLAAIVGLTQQLIELGTNAFITSWLDLPSAGSGINVLPEASVSALVSLFAGGLISIAVVMLAGSILSAFLRFHDFTLTRDDDQLRTRAGMLTIKERSMNRSKIQVITLRQSPVRRWLNRVSIELRQAVGHSVRSRQGARGDSNTRLFIPLTHPSLIDTLYHFAFDGLTTDLDLSVSPRPDTYTPISRRYVRARILLLGVFPAAAQLIAILMHDGSALWYLVPAIWVLAVGVGAILRFRRWGVQYRQDGLAVRSGWLGQRIDALACQKMQSIELSATPWQERAGVANLTIRLAAHNLQIPYLPRTDAARLRDYLLFQVQRSQRHSF